MGFTKIALNMMINDFNKRQKRPYGKLLTLSRYLIDFDKDYFNKNTCKAHGGGVESKN